MVPVAFPSACLICTNAEGVYLANHAHRRRALAVIAAGATTPAEAAARLADPPQTQTPAAPAARSEQAVELPPPQLQPQPSRDAVPGAAQLALAQPAEAGGQHPAGAADTAQPVQASQEQATPAAAKANAAMVHHAAARAPPPVWMLSEASAPVLPHKPVRRGFWGSIGAYIAGSDKRQAPF